VRVVFASQLRIPASSRLFRGRDPGTWVMCAPDAPDARRRRLEAAGARLLDVPSARGGLDLRRALRALARAGLTEILVEGGGELAASLLRLDLVDEVHWFTAPRLLGGDARPSLGSLKARSLAAVPQLRQVEVKRLGEDVYVRGVIDRTHSRRRR
jgi:diaminohydroxyphosphoribosylaminopyrimidine deaminase/5-amino-6-(5-phosphoribosylamino)uracil reductase